MSTTNAEKSSSAPTLPGVDTTTTTTTTTTTESVEPVIVPPAALTATEASAVAPKRGRGRPPKNKTTPGNAATGAPMPTAATPKRSKKKKTPAASDAEPGLFSDGGAVTAAEVQAQIAAGKTPPPAMLMQLPAAEMAQLAIGVGDALATNFGAMRYGESAAAILALSDQEKDMLQVPVAAWIKDALPKLTPIEGIVLILGMLYVPRVGALEIQRLQARKAGRVAA